MRELLGLTRTLEKGLATSSSAYRELECSPNQLPEHPAALRD
jgi:hypothetical protein